jgi:hypothetical protein
MGALMKVGMSLQVSKLFNYFLQYIPNEVCLARATNNV